MPREVCLGQDVSRLSTHHPAMSLSDKNGKETLGMLLKTMSEQFKLFHAEISVEVTKSMFVRFNVFVNPRLMGISAAWLILIEVGAIYPSQRSRTAWPNFKHRTNFDSPG